jgi:hypothetical protein
MNKWLHYLIETLGYVAAFKLIADVDEQLFHAVLIIIAIRVYKAVRQVLEMKRKQEAMIKAIQELGGKDLGNGMFGVAPKKSDKSSKLNLIKDKSTKLDLIKDNNDNEENSNKE